MSTDKQKAIAALAFASETCTAALSSLSVADRHVGLHDQSSEPEPLQPLPVLQKDLKSILSLIYASTTKIALSLKPSSPTYSASLTPVTDIAKHTSALAHCVSLFDAEVHGLALAKEVVFAARDIVEAIRALLQTFMSHVGSHHTADPGDGYMVRTGTVHELIDKMRGPGGISADNFTAVRKRWIEDRGSLEDGFREVGEMVEDGEADGEADEEAEGDGWDELGLGTGKKMNKDELERTKTVHTILRLTTLLHKRILLDLLSTSFSHTSNIALDTLLAHSVALLVVSDDLVSTLYTQQNPQSISKGLTSFVDVVRALQSGLAPFLLEDPSLEEQLGDLNVSRGEYGTQKAKTKRWFETCFAQIYKTSETFAITLDRNIDT